MLVIIIFTDSVRAQLQDDLKVHIRHPKPTGVKLGRGMYGSVIELILDGETVAGKVFKGRSVLSETKRKKLKDEIRIVLGLKHSNIVSSKGICFLPDIVLPVLLMERLMSNLYNYLVHHANSKLSMEQKISILHDVVKGLDFLHNHSPAIIHRDLTARNVLLDSDLRAKISDFGNAKIIEREMNTTKTLQYTSIDILSFGHLALSTVLQKHIQLQPPTSPDSEGKLIHRSEEERREQYILEAEQQFSENKTLLAIIKQCLSIPINRPRAGDLLLKLKPQTPSEF